MKIGLYFGSFNPVHHGHLIIARHVLNVTELTEIWFVVSPQNPFKASSTLLNEHDRLNLVQLAIDGEVQMKASSIEFKMAKPSFTIDTLTYLSEKYPQHIFNVIMGSDSLQNLSKWKNYHELVSNYELIIYERPGFTISNIDEAKITIVKAPMLEISSTHIRGLIKDKKSIRFLVPDQVRDEIENNNYYIPKLKKPTE